MLLMCRIFTVSRSDYYTWKMRSQSAREKENRRLLKQIQSVHKKSRKTYGSPRVHMQLVAQGEACSRGRVERLMSQNGIRAKMKRKFIATTDSKHNYPAAKNLLNRAFSISEPNKVWLSDITYIPTEEGFLYLAGVMDLGSKTAVGWSMSNCMERTLVMDALKMVYQRRRPGKGLIHHSDRGSQYASDEYRNLLKKYNMQISMSRKGNCWDNAPMESFFGTLKRELVHHKKYRT